MSVQPKCNSISHWLPYILPTQAQSIKLCCSADLCKKCSQQCRGCLPTPRYYEEKGFAVILVSRILNLLALAFTIAFSAFLLLSVKWGALHSECILRDTCDISEVSLHTPELIINTPASLGLKEAPDTFLAMSRLQVPSTDAVICLQVAFERHPLKDGVTLWNILRVMYLAIFAAYWLYNLVHMVVDVREAAVIKHFSQHRLGLSPRQLRTVTWPEVARRIVDVSNLSVLPLGPPDLSRASDLSATEAAS